LCELPHAGCASAASKISERNLFQQLFQVFSRTGLRPLKQPPPREISKAVAPRNKHEAYNDRGEFPKLGTSDVARKMKVHKRRCDGLLRQDRRRLCVRTSEIATPFRRVVRYRACCTVSRALPRLDVHRNSGDGTQCGFGLKRCSLNDQRVHPISTARLRYRSSNSFLNGSGEALMLGWFRALMPKEERFLRHVHTPCSARACGAQALSANPERRVCFASAAR